MISWECVKEENATRCQIPFYESGVSTIADLLKLILLIWFTVHIAIRLIGKIIK